MIELTYTNELGQRIRMGQSTPYFVTNLDGFSNVENMIHSIKSPNQDGETEVGSNLDSRYLGIEGEFLSRHKQMTRNNLIKVFNPQLSGVLRYKREGTIREINCRPEGTPILSSSNLSTIPFMINLKASDPFWKDTIDSKYEVAIWRGAFEFPLELLEEGIEMGYREPSLVVNIKNKGNVSTGMRIVFKANGTVVNPSLFNINTREYFKVKKTIVDGERMIVTTGFQNKRVNLEKDGVTSNAFNFIDLSSTFLQLGVGDNLFRYDAEEGVENLEIDIYFTPQYLGV